MEIIPEYKLIPKEKKKVVITPLCPYPLKRWSSNEIFDVPLNDKFIDTMKTLDYKRIYEIKEKFHTKAIKDDKLILRRDVPILEGKIVDELVLKKTNDKYKLSKRELSIKVTPVKIKVDISKAKELSPHISESQLTNINIGICNMQGGDWKRTAKCCDLTKILVQKKK